MTLSEFQISVALLSLPDDRMEQILNMAGEMMDQDRGGFFESLQVASEDNRQNIALEEEALDEMESLVVEVEHIVHHEEVEERDADEKIEHDEELKDIESQLDGG